MAESNPRFSSHPIGVVHSDRAWPDEFVRERQRILECVGAYIVEVADVDAACTSPGPSAPGSPTSA